MKLSVPVVIATAAGLVNAAPIVILYGSKPRPVPDVDAWAQNVRWGHAAANAGFLPAVTAPSPTSYYYNPTPLPTGMAMIMTAPNPTPYPAATGYPTGYTPSYDSELTGLAERLRASFREFEEKNPPRKSGCRMKKMRNKSLQWGNKLRVILGLPPISTPIQGIHPYITETQYDRNGNVVYHREIPESRYLVTHHRHHIRPSHHDFPFHVRLAHALSSLGPWEGRAVSFVLGCGLGVLLRMLFVFSVLIVRAVCCRRKERRVALTEDSVIFIADVKEPVVVETLPAYAEKAETTEAEEVSQTNNAH